MSEKESGGPLPLILAMGVLTFITLIILAIFAMPPIEPSSHPHAYVTVDDHDNSSLSVTWIDTQDRLMGVNKSDRYTTPTHLVIEVNGERTQRIDSPGETIQLTGLETSDEVRVVAHDGNIFRPLGTWEVD